MGDRGGGREPKGASLKKSKKNPGASAAKTKKMSLKALGLQSGPVTSLPPPMPMFSEGINFDCGVALLSRQFDRDRDRVIQRAQAEGKCQGMLLWFADIEKQQSIADICKTNSGVCYYATGVHPDNIDRTNKKSHEEWMEKVEELGKKSECLAILSGLNLSREMATHFSQENLFKAAHALAVKIALPLALHIADNESLDRTLELLSEAVTEGTTNVLIHDVITATGADERFLDIDGPFLCNENFYYAVTAAGITDPEDAIRTAAIALLRALPLERLLVASDSPWRTPQNLSDPYLRTIRNEPANLPAIIEALADIRGLPVEQMTTVLRANSLRVLGLEFIESNSNIAAVATVAEAEAEDVEGEEQDGPAEAAEAVDEEEGQEVAAKLATLTVAPSPVAPVAPVVKPKAAVPYYSCAKCRAKLFSANEVVPHTFSTGKKAVFKVGEEGLCASFVFVSLASELLARGVVRLNTVGDSAACVSCGCKLGKHSEYEALCSCGKAVPGPIGKLVASKLDFCDVSVSTTETIAQLAERARLEASLRAAVEAEAEEPEAEKRKIKKGKKHKSENRGNFSSFRNKSFVPNASKKRDVAVGDREDHSGDSDA